MKNMKRIFTSLLMTLVLVMALAPAAMAADTTATVEITGKKDTFVFSPGGTESSTDLFPNFKNLMPGDTVTQPIKIVHKGVGLGSVRLSMRVVPHGYRNYPQSDVLKHEASLAEMNDFLSQLELKIYKGSKTSVKPIFDGTMDSSHQLTDFRELAVFKKGSVGTLTLELTVPIELGNDFADRMGEFDLEFMVEEIPAAIIPQTGDTTNIGLLITVSAVSLGAIIVVVIILLKKKKK